MRMKSSWLADQQTVVQRLGDCIGHGVGALLVEKEVCGSDTAEWLMHGSGKWDQLVERVSVSRGDGVAACLRWNFQRVEEEIGHENTYRVVRLLCLLAVRVGDPQLLDDARHITMTKLDDNGTSGLGRLKLKTSLPKPQSSLNSKNKEESPMPDCSYADHETSLPEKHTETPNSRRPAPRPPSEAARTSILREKDLVEDIVATLVHGFSSDSLLAKVHHAITLIGKDDLPVHRGLVSREVRRFASIVERSDLLRRAANRLDKSQRSVPRALATSLRDRLNVFLTELIEAPEVCEVNTLVDLSRVLAKPISSHLDTLELAHLTTSFLSKETSVIPDSRNLAENAILFAKQAPHSLSRSVLAMELLSPYFAFVEDYLVGNGNKLRREFRSDEDGSFLFPTCLKSITEALTNLEEIRSSFVRITGRSTIPKAAHNISSTPSIFAKNAPVRAYTKAESYLDLSDHLVGEVSEARILQRETWSVSVLKLEERATEKSLVDKSFSIFELDDVLKRIEFECVQPRVAAIERRILQFIREEVRVVDTLHRVLVLCWGLESDWQLLRALDQVARAPFRLRLQLDLEPTGNAAVQSGGDLTIEWMDDKLHIEYDAGRSSAIGNFLNSKILSSISTTAQILLKLKSASQRLHTVWDSNESPKWRFAAQQLRHLVRSTEQHVFERVIRESWVATRSALNETVESISAFENKLQEFLHFCEAGCLALPDFKVVSNYLDYLYEITDECFGSSSLTETRLDFLLSEMKHCGRFMVETLERLTDTSPNGLEAHREMCSCWDFNNFYTGDSLSMSNL